MPKAVKVVVGLLGGAVTLFSAGKLIAGLVSGVSLPALGHFGFACIGAALCLGCLRSAFREPREEKVMTAAKLYEWGCRYERGRGIYQDLKEAHECYKKAAAAGHEGAKAALNRLDG